MNEVAEAMESEGLIEPSAISILTMSLRLMIASENLEIFGLETKEDRQFMQMYMQYLA
jgi:hypothetical protein